MESHNCKPVVIIDGWLTKSPPVETKSIFAMKPRWRRRYFVLYWTTCGRVDCSNPRTAILSYHENESCFRQNEIKGNIDLVHCKEIHSHVKTHSYEHAFSLRTRHKQTFRLYCLAADTKDAMEKWFRSVYEVLLIIKAPISRTQILSANSLQCCTFPALSRTLPAKSRKPVTSLIYEVNGNRRATSVGGYPNEILDSGICSPIYELESDVPTPDEDYPRAAGRNCAAIQFSSELSASLALLETESRLDADTSDCDIMSASIYTESKIIQSGASNVLQANRQTSNSSCTPIPMARTKAKKKKLSLTGKQESFLDQDISINNAQSRSELSNSESQLCIQPAPSDHQDSQDNKFLLRKDRRLSIRNVTTTESNADDVSDENKGRDDEAHEKLLSCSVCLEIFTDPRNLPCGHTFCRCCLEGIAIHSEKEFPCPVCNGKFETDIASLPKNYVVQNLSELARKRNSSKVEFDDKQADDTQDCSNHDIPRKLELVSDHSPDLTKIELKHARSIELNCGKRITGITVSEDRVYFVSEFYNGVEIYDLQSSSFLPTIVLDQLKCPRDLSFCSISDSFFIIDMDFGSNCVWKMNHRTCKVKKWMTGVKDPYTLSTTSSGQLLMLHPAGEYSWHLGVYTTSDLTAKQVKLINLSPAIKCPRHAISPVPGQLYVCYGTGYLQNDGHWSVWTISQISENGNIMRSLSTPLSGPLYYLSSSDGEALFVSEGKTKQVVCIDSSLKQTGMLKMQFGDRIWEPWKLCVPRQTQLLIIGHITKLCDMFTYLNEVHFEDFLNEAEETSL